VQVETIMSFCEHCQGQRFDRAQVLRTLRAERRRLRTSRMSADCERILAAAIEKVRALDLPHLDPVDEVVDGEVIH
jgi:hypothetical protein